MKVIKIFADNTNRHSYAARMRQKRFAYFLNLLQQVPKPVEILDIGGTEKFWEMMEFVEVAGIHITLLNLNKPPVKHENFTGLAGDATNLSTLQDNQFDIVFSNSVIEHVGNYDRQRRMAQEVQRVGQRYFVQTPNYFFPIEPHFLFVGFQWLPLSIRAFLHSRYNLGWMKRVPDPEQARKSVESVRLLRKRELLALFPGAKLYQEKLFGLTKSLTVYDGW